MSEQPKKARDIKDLKARLGRAPGAAPGVPGAPASGVPAPFPAPGIPAPAIPGPAAVPSPFAPRADAGLPPADPFAPPPAKSVPPGMMPAARASVPPPAAPAPAMSADPFAAAAPVAAAQEIRLVIDEKAVSDAEVGRRSGGKMLLPLVAAAIVGIGVGWMVGGTTRERSLYNLVLQDAKDIYGTASNAAPTVEKAQKLLDQAVRAAGGATPTIDVKALEELRKLEKPIQADAFARKHYRAFEPATVDSLFTYYNNVNLLWMKIAALSARGLNPNTRATLETAAKAAGLDYGCVPFSEGEQWGCGLVTVSSVEGDKAKVTLRGASYDKTLYAGQDIKAKASDFVIRVDRARSGEVLSGTTSLFQSYARELVEAKTLVGQTVEIQGRLIQQLGTVAKLESL